MTLPFKIALTATLIIIPCWIWARAVWSPWTNDALLPGCICCALCLVAIAAAVVDVWNS